MKRLALFAMLLVPAAAPAQLLTYVKQFTRPANATPYTAGDVVCGTDSLPTLLVPLATGNGNGTIWSVRLMCDTANAASGTFRLFLYADSAGLGKIADNTAHVYTDARDSLLIDVVDLTLVSTGTASATAAYGVTSSGFGAGAGLKFKAKTGASGKGVWGRLTATAGYVPKQSGKVRLAVVASY